MSETKEEIVHSSRASVMQKILDKMAYYLDSGYPNDAEKLAVIYLQLHNCREISAEQIGIVGRLETLHDCGKPVDSGFSDDDAYMDGHCPNGTRSQWNIDHPASAIIDKHLRGKIAVKVRSDLRKDLEALYEKPTETESVKGYDSLDFDYKDAFLEAQEKIKRLRTENVILRRELGT